MIHLPRLLVVILLIGSCAFAQTKPAQTDARGVTIADFEKGRPITLRPANATATIAPGDAAQGEGFLQLAPNTDEAGKAYLRLPLPDDADASSHEQLAAQLRAPQAGEKVKLTWLALDEGGHPIFHRTFELDPGQQWTKLESPLRAWRWDVRRIADWDEVEAIVLRIDSPGVKRIDVDDIRLVGTRDAGDDGATPMLDLAFGADRPRDVLSAGGLLVATDAIDGFTEADLQHLLADMKRTRAFVRRAFGDAVRPTDDLGAPAMLLIFADDAQRDRFFDRLGAQWRATIARSKAQGFTVQDIATATYRADLGVRRPVYLHESTHAVVARDVRLLTANAAHAPLQEGIAAYIQLCVHPESIDRRLYAKSFSQPIDPAGKGFFKPLDQLFAKRPTTSEYAQLASVVAYLVEKDQPLLRDLAKGLAAGESATDILTRRGTSWAEVQDKWLTWSREHFAHPANDGSIFEKPAEFR